jgi:hypothetical protein
LLPADAHEFVNKITPVQGVSARGNRASGGREIHRAGKYEDSGERLVDPNPK